jgi:hypothetical protein
MTESLSGTLSAIRPAPACSSSEQEINTLMTHMFQKERAVLC